MRVRILFFGRNFKAVFVIWSVSGALFFVSEDICFCICPEVTKTFESFITVFFSRWTLISTAGRLLPEKVLNCHSRESTNNSVFSYGEKVSPFGPRIGCVASFFLRRYLFSLKIEFSFSLWFRESRYLFHWSCLWVWIMNLMVRNWEFRDLLMIRSWESCHSSRMRFFSLISCWISGGMSLRSFWTYELMSRADWIEFVKISILISMSNLELMGGFIFKVSALSVWVNLYQLMDKVGVGRDVVGWHGPKRARWDL